VTVVHIDLVELVTKIIFFIVLIYLSVADLKKRAVPIAGLFIAGIIAAVGMVISTIIEIHGTQLFNYSGKWLSVVLGMIPGIMVIFLALATKKIGIADGVLLCIIGMIENYISIVIILSIGSFIMALLSIVLLIIKRANRNTKLPFIPFLSLGFLIKQIVVLLV